MGARVLAACALLAHSAVPVLGAAVSIPERGAARFTCYTVTKVFCCLPLCACCCPVHARLDTPCRIQWLPVGGREWESWESNFSISVSRFAS